MRWGRAAEERGAVDTTVTTVLVIVVVVAVLVPFGSLVLRSTGAALAQVLGQEADLPVAPVPAAGAGGLGGPAPPLPGDVVATPTPSPTGTPGRGQGSRPVRRPAAVQPQPAETATGLLRFLFALLALAGVLLAIPLAVSVHRGLRARRPRPPQRQAESLGPRARKPPRA